MHDRTELALTPSRPLALLAAAPWVLPALLAWWLPAPLWARLALLALITMAAVRNALHQGWPGRHVGLRALHRQGPQLRVTLPDGQILSASPQAHSRLWGGLLWLSLRHGQGRHRLILCARQGLANCQGEPLRELTLWLRLGHRE
ncbi:MAG: hypothetical protein R3296_11130 [Oleiphilaceae bacterium]|nr:hypothetical protein [Oleiphilaceae bacterium]